jgi:uncharacterized protein (TIGR01319 family)
MISNHKKLDKFCLIDIGSTTTKAFLFIKNPNWHYYREEKPTTVEKPYEDVTFGVINVLRALEEVTREKLITDNRPVVPCFSTSSAGGGLAVVVAGLIREVTSKSAERAALGAGAIIQGVIALDDNRTPYKKIEVLKKLRPDMLLLAGGFDGGSVAGPVFLSEIISQSSLRPKLIKDGKLPIIYAGNKKAREYVAQMLREEYILYSIPNLRPSNQKENLEPTRNSIHDVFMEHVMSRAPGYEKYKEWISAPIMPTPAAVGKLLELVSKDMNSKLLAIDIGGATTDVFTADHGKVFRTVSANLGMSYSMLNVVKQSGIEPIHELLETDIDTIELMNRLGNKYLRPTELPRDIENTEIECAVASVAIREAVREHFRVMYGISMSLSGEELNWNMLKTNRKAKTKTFETPSFGDYDMVIGSGGKLSHSPRRTASMILLNALEPIGSLRMAVDSVFMFPQLGILSQVDPDLVLELFHKFGLVKLGKIIAPSGNARPGTDIIKIDDLTNQGKKIKSTSKAGEVNFLNLDDGDSAQISLKIRKLKLKNKHISLDSSEGELILDARGRPSRKRTGFHIPDDYQPTIRKAVSEYREKIYNGQIRIKRELAVSGEVYVKNGDRVEPDTKIAKSIRSFLRPFFLNVSEKLGLPPEQIMKVMLKKPGDEIKQGDNLAEYRENLFRTKVFRSTVSGTIEKILPNGLVIVREKMEFANKLFMVDASHELSIQPPLPSLSIKCEIGQEIEKGQMLAAIGRLSDQKVCRSPIRGKVKSISLEDGTIVIEPLLEELHLNAWLPGIVENVSDKGCDVINSGTIIRGVWGNDGQVHGLLSIDDISTGSIVLRDFTSMEEMKLFQEAKVTGLITGGLNLMDFTEIQPDFPIVVINQFGAKKITSEIYDLLVNNINSLCLLDAGTQLRAGVQRPKVIIPQN